MSLGIQEKFCLCVLFFMILKISDSFVEIISLYIILYLVPDILKITYAKNYFISVF